EVALEERGDCLVQPHDIALAARAHHDTSGKPRAQRRFVLALAGFIAAAIDLVEDEEARYGLRADLVEHFLGYRELTLEPRIAGVHDVDEQRSLERLVERRLERCDEPVRQVLDEADRVADEHAWNGLRMQSAHGSIQRREELIRDERLASRQGAHQGGLARIRISDERHAREPLALLPPGALRLAPEVRRVEL